MNKGKSNNMSYVLAVVLLLLSVGVYALFSGGEGGDKNEANSTFSRSQLSAVSKSFDFGTINMREGDVAHEFAVSNDGNEPIKIEKVYTSCMCTKAIIKDSSGKKRGTFGMPGHGLSSKTNIEVMPGENVSVEAVFDPAAHGPSGVGLANRSIYIETNSAASPKLELSFQAMVTRQ